MPVPPVSSDQSPVLPAPARRSPAGSARLGRARVAVLVLAATLAGTACGQSDETVSPDVRLSGVVTGQGVDALPIDRTAGSDPATVRADGVAPAAPAAGLGGVAAAPPTVAPAPAAPAPAAASTVAPAPASAAAPVATVTPTTADPAAAGGGSAPAASPAPAPTVAVSGGDSPAPTPTPTPTTAAAPPATVSEADLAAGEERSFVLLNEFRSGMSLPAMTRDPALDTLAREWSSHMAETGDLSHSENPYGENIAFTSNASLTAAEAAQVFERLWSEDPAHSQNMMGAYVKVGVGVWRSDRGWYGTHLFNY